MSELKMAEDAITQALLARLNAEVEGKP